MGVLQTGRCRPLWHLAVGAALVAGVYVPFGCARRSAGPGTEAKEAVVPVVLRPIRTETVQRGVEVVGTLFGDDEATLSSKVAGRIAMIYKDMGDRARPGEILAQVETKDFELAQAQRELAIRELLAKLGLAELPPEDYDVRQVPTVERAKLQADNAKAKYERGRQLHDQKPPLMSDQDFADLQTTWEVARSNYDVEILTAAAMISQARTRKGDLAIAEQRLADTAIRAPEIGGTTTAPAGGSNPPGTGEMIFAVATRFISVGEFVTEGKQAFRLVKDDPIKLRAAVPERFIGEVKVGQQTALRVEAYENEFEGSVSRINPAVDAANRTFQVEVVVPNPQHLLRPGSFGRGFVKTHLEKDVIFAPLEAVLSFAGVNKVFTVKDGKAVEVLVSLGDRRGNSIEITKGLAIGDSVVVSGNSKLADGVPVLVRSPKTERAEDETPDSMPTVGERQK